MKKGAWEAIGFWATVAAVASAPSLAGIITGALAAAIVT